MQIKFKFNYPLQHLQKLEFVLRHPNWTSFENLTHSFRFRIFLNIQITNLTLKVRPLENVEVAISCQMNEGVNCNTFLGCISY